MILEISQGDHVIATATPFLIDHQAKEIARDTLRFWREFLCALIAYCNANSLTFIQEIIPGFLRRYFLAFGENHNPEGVHAAYRTLRPSLPWQVKEEIMSGLNIKAEFSQSEVPGRVFVTPDNTNQGIWYDVLPLSAVGVKDISLGG